MRHSHDLLLTSLKQSVVDDIINTVNGLIYKSVSYVEELLQNADPAALGFKAAAGPANGVADANMEGEGSYPPEAKLEIEEGIHKLETLFESTIDRDFDKLEIYALRNVFMVPDDVLDWMRLRHYEVSSRANSLLDRTGLPSPTILVQRQLIDFPVITRTRA
jgi:kinetochore protein Mis12/MTW1